MNRDFLCHLVAVACVCAWPQAKCIADDDQLVKNVIMAPSEFESSKARKLLIKGLPIDELRDLKSHQHDTIALLAAWDEVQESLPNDPEAKSTAVNLEPFQRFIGFCEGRLRISVPAGWEKALLSAGTHGDSHLFFEKRPDGTGNYLRNYRVYVPSGITLEANSKNSTIKIGEQQFELPMDAWRARGPDDRLAAVVIDDRCLFAIHRSTGSPFDLYCLGPGGKKIWKANVWPDGGMFMLTGMGYWHHVTITTTKERVTLFGVCNFAAYIESFDLATGANKCRFSTSY